jgi:hypothetical protein
MMFWDWLYTVPDSVAETPTNKEHSITNITPINIMQINRQREA